MYDVPLPGCRPEPLAHYLKGLAVLRLVAEQADPRCRGWWEKDVFWLRSSMDQDGLSRFFLEEYRPTPIIVPWSGSDFFGVNRGNVTVLHDKVPTASRIIESLLATTTVRLAPYRDVVNTTLDVMASENITDKKVIEGASGKNNKMRLIRALRSRLPENVLAWIDAASLVQDKDLMFNTLLGSGGGNDGNSHFSDNFMQCLWLCLPDFLDQKGNRIQNFSSAAAIRQSLFGGNTPNALIKGRSPGLYNSFDVGGPNAGNGFEREAQNNPWDYILTLEAMACFGGAVTRRFGVSTAGRSAFPFVVQTTPVGYASSGDQESNGREIWLPLWGRPAAVNEVKYLFSEGRAQVGRRNASVGTDFARAIASLGTDKGIVQFQRYGLLRGRVGGDNYHTAVSFGRWTVSHHREIDLLNVLDEWLDRFRGKAMGDQAPARMGRALCAIEGAILDFCQTGGRRRFAEILIALGEAEAALAASPKFRKDAYLPPVPLLSAAWLDACNDGSTEFRLAAALASTGLRENLEPVYVGRRAAWLDVDDHPRVVWGAGDLISNLGDVLQRRCMDAQREGKASLPLRGKCFASLGDVAAFVRGEVDDQRLEGLLKGLCLLDGSALQRHLGGSGEPLPPVIYGLLKMVHLPHPLREVAIPWEASIMAKALAGDGAQASRLAVRRLRGSGFQPMLEVAHEPAAVVRRAAAALLIPIAEADAQRLAEMVIQRSAADPDSAA